MPKSNHSKEQIEKLRKIFIDEFNVKLEKMVERSLELSTTYTKNAPYIYLGEATECFINGFFNASIALSRATLEQVLKHKLNINKSEIIDLTCLIKLATSQQLLSNNLKSNAIKIQKWGNIYIHDTGKKDVNYQKQKRRSKEVLLALKKTIEELYAFSRKKGKEN